MAGTGSDLERFIDTLETLDQGELLALSAAYRSQDADARDAAESALEQAAERRGLRARLSRLDDQVGVWAGTYGAGMGVWSGASQATDYLLADIRLEAAPALRNAAAAILVGDALDPGSRRVLLEPWRRVRP